MDEAEVNGRNEKRPVMQIITNRGPLNRAIFKVSQAIGLISQTAVAPPEETGGTTDLTEPADELAVQG